MKKRFGGILGALLILLVMGMTVCAADAGDIKKNTVLQTNSEVELHEAPDASSAVTATLPSGTPVIIKEDAADGWCKAAYKEDEGYVQTSCLGGIGSQSTPAADETQPADGDEAAKGDDAVPENGNALDDRGSSDSGLPGGGDGEGSGGIRESLGHRDRSPGGCDICSGHYNYGAQQ